MVAFVAYDIVCVILVPVCDSAYDISAAAYDITYDILVVAYDIADIFVRNIGIADIAYDVVFAEQNAARISELRPVNLNMKRQLCTVRLKTLDQLRLSNTRVCRSIAKHIETASRLVAPTDKIEHGHKRFVARVGNSAALNYLNGKAQTARVGELNR